MASIGHRIGLRRRGLAKFLRAQALIQPVHLIQVKCPYILLFFFTVLSLFFCLFYESVVCQLYVFAFFYFLFFIFYF